MRSTWLEDFLSLANTRNFSRSAEERNVTQPAFSRRIKALEMWLGVDLLDRNSYPPTLTAAGATFRNIAQDLLKKIHEARDLLRGETTSSSVVHFAAPHALVPTILSSWIMEICVEIGEIIPRITAANAFDGLVLLGEDQGYDFVIAYFHDQVSIRLPEDRYSYQILGREKLLPVTAADSFGQPLFRLPGHASRPIPYFAYTPGLFMGKIVEMILARADHTAQIRKCYETDLLDAVKSMVASGRGMAWLPENLVARDLAARKLASAGTDEWSEQIEIRLYYSLRNKRPLPARLWEFLNQNHRPVYRDAQQAAT